MSCRPILVLLALTLTPTLTACGDDEAPPRASSTLQLNGTYRPTEQGPIGSVSFSNGKDYVLVPSGCESSECQDVGTYQIDAATSTVFLENARTHRTKTITLEDVKTVSAGAAVVQSLGTREALVGSNSPTTTTGNETTSTGNQTTTTGNQTTTTGNQTTTTDNELMKGMNQLFDVVIAAAMNGQGVQRQ